MLNSGGTAGYNVNWSTGANTNSITVSPTITSIYNYTVTDANNCVDTKSVQINVQSIIADFDNSNSLCSSLISFTNTSSNSSIIEWNYGDGNTSFNNTTIQNSYLSAGIYSVTLIAISAIGCKDTVQKTINISSNFVSVDFSNEFKKNKCVDSVYFKNTSNGSNTYMWHFGDGSSSAVSEPTHLFPIGVYTVSLWGSNGICTDSIIKEIEIKGNDVFEENIPNVFTPNNDGVNDVFDFKMTIPCEAFTFEIYDRWGLLILDSKNSHQNFWDGRTTAGEKVTDGVYFYVLNSETKKLKGIVTLFR